MPKYNESSVRVNKSNSVHQKEEWKDIHDYEGYYQISSKGKIRSLDRIVTINGWQRLQRGKELSPYAGGPGGYPMVCLAVNGHKHKDYIHRLVAEAFIPNPDSKPEVDHIDCDILNNSVDNLRWVSREENLNNPITRKRNSQSRKGWYQPKGELNSRSKTVQQYTLDGRLLKEWIGVRQIQRETGYTQSSISNCCRGNGKSAYGYVWKYKDETL